MGFYPVAVSIIRENTQITHHAQTNTAHKTTQTIKDRLHTMNAMQIQLQIQP
jgi:hypothetical protein